MTTLFDWIAGATLVISNFIPVLLGFMFVAFLVNVIRFFILQSGSEAGREKARLYLLWSIIGFVVVFALWGIVSLLMSFIGVTPNSDYEQVDYVELNTWSPTCPIDHVGPC